MERVWILTKFGFGAIVLCLVGPSLLDLKTGIAFVVGFAAIATILFRNRWRRFAGVVSIITILNVYAVWSSLYLPRWQTWAKNYPATIEKGTSQRSVIRNLWWHSSMTNVRTEGSKSFIDIHPVGPAGWISWNYWRVVLDLDESQNVLAARSVEVRW